MYVGNVGIHTHTNAPNRHLFVSVQENINNKKTVHFIPPQNQTPFINARLFTLFCKYFSPFVCAYTVKA